MNYIIHLNKTFAVFCEDERLTPYHVSLYFSLFQYWNMAKFRNPISISRDELMRASKIGSVNTYIRSIKELHSWSYIKYIPSYNPQKGSQVYLYTFDNSSNNSKNNSSDNGIDISHHKGTGKTSYKAGETQMIPSINSLNKSNKLKHKKYEHTPSKKSKKSFSSTTRSSVKGGSKAKRKVASKKIEPPTFKEIEIHFIENKWPLLEAEKFFNYYSSNGWLVGGKTPMQNWKSSAKNWMLKADQFSPVPVVSLLNPRGIKGEVKPGKLKISNDKNYAEPL